MSGIAGIVNFDGKPVDQAQMSGMLDIIKHRGPDGTGKWIQGPVGLGHQMLQTTPESLHERQPLLDETLYLGILRLLPAHCLAIDKDQLRIQRY